MKDHTEAAVEGFKEHAVASVCVVEKLFLLTPWAEDSRGCGFGDADCIAFLTEA